MRALAWSLAVIPLASMLAMAQRGGTFTGSRDHPAIQYSKAVSNDPVAQLARRIDDGRVQLAFDPIHGYLPGLLDALKIPVESQVVVFSQTSKQAELISPKNPRALYFSEAAAVGFVKGSDELEVTAIDPVIGAVFYALEQRASDRPRFKRDDAECLACHQTWDTLGVPGWSMVSTFSAPAPDDKYSYASGGFSDHRTPFSERWGGWFVTGKLGNVKHLGNETNLARGNGRVPAVARSIESLDGAVDPKMLLSRHSDVAALMVLEHQVTMTNLITRTGWEARVAPEGPAVRDAAVELVDYLLFVDEPPLPSPVAGSSGFSQVFTSRGPQDSRGRSLRQLDLQRRLLRYPCSYMIYADAFEELPSAAKAAVYDRLWKVLSGQVTDNLYARISKEDRVAITEILRDTKRGLPDYFNASLIR